MEVDRAAEIVARAFHEHYEWWAERHGWKSQVGATVAWNEVPEANRETMISTARSLLEIDAIRVGTYLEALDHALLTTETPSDG